MSYCISEHTVHMYAPLCTRFCNCYIAVHVQPIIISTLVMYMGVCMQLGDVYMGRCIAGIDIQF